MARVSKTSPKTCTSRRRLTNGARKVKNFLSCTAEQLAIVKNQFKPPMQRRRIGKTPPQSDVEKSADFQIEATEMFQEQDSVAPYGPLLANARRRLGRHANFEQRLRNAQLELVRMVNASRKQISRGYHEVPVREPEDSDSDSDNDTDDDVPPAPTNKKKLAGKKTASGPPPKKSQKGVSKGQVPMQGIANSSTVHRVSKRTDQPSEVVKLNVASSNTASGASATQEVNQEDFRVYLLREARKLAHWARVHNARANRGT